MTATSPTEQSNKFAGWQASASQDTSPTAEKAECSGALLTDKSESTKHVEEEEYKLKLAEKRRQARELAERKAAEEKRLVEEQKLVVQTLLFYHLYIDT
jgi:hypothetical protein